MLDQEFQSAVAKESMSAQRHGELLAFLRAAMKQHGQDFYMTWEVLQARFGLLSNIWPSGIPPLTRTESPSPTQDFTQPSTSTPCTETETPPSSPTPPPATTSTPSATTAIPSIHGRPETPSLSPGIQLRPLGHHSSTSSCQLGSPKPKRTASSVMRRAGLCSNPVTWLRASPILARCLGQFSVTCIRIACIS